jgi:hypothetical protein
VPIYVLEKPRSVLDQYNLKNKLDEAITKTEEMAFDRIDAAINSLKDPEMLMRCLNNNVETLESSSRIIHRWSTKGVQSYCEKPW